MASNTDRPLLIKVESVAEKLQFGRSKTYALLREGVIPSVLVGGSRRVRARDLEKYVEGLDAA
jgi:excisionase family DNA binding protein